MIRARGGTALGGGCRVWELPSLSASWEGCPSSSPLHPVPLALRAATPHPQKCNCPPAYAHSCLHRTSRLTSDPVIPEHALLILPPLCLPGICRPSQSTPVWGPPPCTPTPRALGQWPHGCQLSFAVWPVPEGVQQPLWERTSWQPAGQGEPWSESPAAVRLPWIRVCA